MSTIPAAIDAIVAALRRALPTVQVLDGGPTRDTEPDLIAVGYTLDGGPEVTSALSREQLNMTPDLERYDITCQASAWRGDAHDDEHRPSMKTVRDRAFQLLDAVRQVLANDPQLGGIVMMARMSTAAMAADQTDKGPVCTVTFTVHVDAFSP